MNEEVNKLELYGKICDRALALGFCFDRVSLLMDIASADKVFHLRLQEWLDAANLEFAQDLCGIVDSIERKVYPDASFGDFVPKFKGED